MHCPLTNKDIYGLMKRKEYNEIEKYMLSCCGESVHDAEHIYRVLYNAMDIAATEKDVNTDVLITACLLHDIARADELNDKTIDHAVYGSEKAYNWLIGHGFGIRFSESVRDCIKTHRYRGNNAPESIEAKILYDSDKIDAAGYMGIARTLMYKGLISQPLYTTENGIVQDGSGNRNSFFGEYVFKLSKVYSRLFTDRAKEITAEMKHDAEHFYNTLYRDINNNYVKGQAVIDSILEP